MDLPTFKHEYKTDDEFFRESNSVQKGNIEKRSNQINFKPNINLQEKDREYFCSTCPKSFRKNHYLQLHLEEAHSPFFLIKVEKKSGELIYHCLDENCQEMFPSHKLRKVHWHEKHFQEGQELPPFILHNQNKKQRQKKNKPKTATKKVEEAAM